MCRWITSCICLAALGVGLQTIAGTLGGYLAGNPSMVSEIVRRLGWEVFTTFYVPDAIVATLISRLSCSSASG